MAPDPAIVSHYEEPVAEATIMCPREVFHKLHNNHSSRAIL